MLEKHTVLREKVRKFNLMYYRFFLHKNSQFYDWFSKKSENPRFLALVLETVSYGWLLMLQCNVVIAGIRPLHWFFVLHFPALTPYEDVSLPQQALQFQFRHNLLEVQLFRDLPFSWLFVFLSLPGTFYNTKVMQNN